MLNATIGLHLSTLKEGQGLQSLLPQSRK